ncbi:MAG TPA: hypothetical protein VKI44_18970 [Acetobacteraceae bacterium]|nr:hypothetical protein [Acetobacteraceae bacterium]
MSDFVARHRLWTETQTQAAAEVAERIAKLGVVRFGFSDAHGVVRGKTLVATEAAGALRSGVTCTLTMLLKDLSGRTAFPIFQRGGDGAGDMVLAQIPPRSACCPRHRTADGSCAISIEPMAALTRSPRVRCCAACWHDSASAVWHGARGWKWNSIC